MSKSKIVPKEMKRLQKYRHILLNFKNFSKTEQKMVLENLPSDFVKLICELCYNYESGKINTRNSKKLETLKRYKRHIQSLSDSQTPLSTHKHTILKGGSLLPVLLKNLAPLALSVLFQGIQNG
jgi:hypothetical protein